jgi:threonine dehydrogenase-like Zn-dependent dehydrogenase
MRDHRLQVEEVPTPEPGSGQVLVRIRACGICGSDLHFFHHAEDMVRRAEELGAPVDELKRGLRCGLVLGHEFVAEVVDFGPETQRRLTRGDRVCSMPFVLKGGVPMLLGSNPETPGAYAEYMVLSESLLLKTPEETPDEAAAWTEPVGIAVHAVNRAALQPNDIAVVLGCGPIGLAITAVLRRRGVRTIIASDLSPRRRELVGVVGADQVVDGRLESAVLIAAAKAAASGGQVVVFENTGASGVLGRVVLEAPQGARVVVTGIAPGEEPILPMLAVSKELRLDFVIYYTAAEFAEALELVSNWRPVTTGKVGLDGVEAAFAALSDPERHAKILIEPWRDGGLSTS